MALTKETVIDQISIIENGTVLYRKATRIIEDGVKIGENYHRASLTPGQDVSSEPDSVRKICTAAWTPEVIAAYQERAAI